MKKIDLGQVIQVVANLGVVAGIIFLALEIRQNSDLLSSQTRFNNLQNQMSLATMLVEDGELTELVARVMDGETISRAESLRLRQMVIMVLNTWEYEYREFEDGRLARDELKVDSKRQDYLLFSELAPGLWEQFKIGAHPPFIEFVETEIQ
jgi:hypothetical protein